MEKCDYCNHVEMCGWRDVLNGQGCAFFDEGVRACTAKFPTYEQIAKDVAEKALDEFLYDGKTLREWIGIITDRKAKTGRWVEVIDEINSFGSKTWHHECSICGNTDSGWGEYKYCPHCGARMESEG